MRGTCWLLAPATSRSYPPPLLGVDNSTAASDHNYPATTEIGPVERRKGVPMPGPEDPQALLERALTAARQGAALASRLRSDGIGTVETKSTVTDMVTSADRAVEELISRLLLDGHPTDELLAEEASAAAQPIRAPTDDGSRTKAGPTDASPTPVGGTRWVVDPIDGTVNYVYGIPHYAVSIAAEVAGAVVAGVVVNVATGEEWTAVAGGGAWRAGGGRARDQLHGPSAGELNRALVATGFGYDARRRRHQAAVVAELLPRVRDIRRFGAAALDLCAVAEGRFDAYYEKGLAAWDQAAGVLIATEAGVRVTGLRGMEPGPAMVLAAPAPLHSLLHDLLVAFDADGGP